MALSSGSLAANSSNGENLAAVSQRISRWAALQGWTGGRIMEKERQRDRDKERKRQREKGKGEKRKRKVRKVIEKET